MTKNTSTTETAAETTAHARVTALAANGHLYVVKGAEALSGGSFHVRAYTLDPEGMPVCVNSVLDGLKITAPVKGKPEVSRFRDNGMDFAFVADYALKKAGVSGVTVHMI